MVISRFLSFGPNLGIFQKLPTIGDTLLIPRLFRCHLGSPDVSFGCPLVACIGNTRILLPPPNPTRTTFPPLSFFLILFFFSTQRRNRKWKSAHPHHFILTDSSSRLVSLIYLSPICLPFLHPPWLSSALTRNSLTSDGKRSPLVRLLPDNEG